ncbi:MAG: hypothetical protein QXY10_03265, partial [Candidatus Micrarchaeaceae archaeon]
MNIQAKKDYSESSFAESAPNLIRSDKYSEIENLEKDADKFAEGDLRSVEKSLYGYETALKLAESENMQEDIKRILEKNVSAYEKIGDLALSYEYWYESAAMYATGASLAMRYGKEEKAKELAKKAIGAYVSDAERVRKEEYIVTNYTRAAIIAITYDLPEKSIYISKSVELLKRAKEKNKASNPEDVKRIDEYIEKLSESKLPL